MPEINKWELVQLDFPSDCNIILGQSHFIKTVEDLFEALATSSPALQFGIAFCEASGDCLIRFDGNNEELVKIAVDNMNSLGAGHSFLIVLKNGYPINVLNRIRDLPVMMVEPLRGLNHTRRRSIDRGARAAVEN